MDIIKYFFEEPFRVPSQNPERLREADSEEHIYRGYLAGTDLRSGRVGLTAVSQPQAFLKPLLRCLERMGPWHHADVQDNVIEIDVELSSLLMDPSSTRIIAAGRNLSTERMTATARSDRWPGPPAFWDLMDVATAVLLPEPAHHGFDWTILTQEPFKDKLVVAFKEFATDGVRRFVLPYQKARTEERFYFDLWQLDREPLPDYIVEV